MSKIKRTNMRYPTIFEPAKEGGFNGFFPSFPGCVTFGRDFEEAKTKAKEVLELWLEELSANGETIPTSRCKNNPLPVGTFWAIVKQSKIPKEKFSKHS